MRPGSNDPREADARGMRLVAHLLTALSGGVVGFLVGLLAGLPWRGCL
ncbi:hypothetical protein [Xanthobacter sp. 126]|nr:hypothetical protein [Xanthobacter sp. 126]